MGNLFLVLTLLVLDGVPTLVGFVHGEGLVLHEQVLRALFLQDGLVADPPAWIQLFPKALLALVIAAQTADLRDGVEDQEHPAVGYQGDGQGGVVPRGPAAPLIPIDVHDDPCHPDSDGEQAGYQDAGALCLPLLVFPRHDGQTRQHHRHQQGHHVDQRHDKVLAGNVAGRGRASAGVGGVGRAQWVTHHRDNEPLCVDDHLHQPQCQRSQTQGPRLGPAVPPGENVQLHTLHQEAGEAAAEQHPEEEPPGRAGGEVLPHDEGEGQAEEAGGEDQEDQVQRHRPPAVLVLHEWDAGQLRNEEHEGEDHAGRRHGLQHDAPCGAKVTQVVVERVHIGATALWGEVGGHGRSWWHLVGRTNRQRLKTKTGTRHAVDTVVLTH